MIFSKNISPFLAIDEVSLSHGELYTVLSNKLAHGKQGTIIAMIKGTQADNIIEILRKIPERARNKVKEVSLDMAPSMIKIVTHAFPKAVQVTDRFHVQQLAFDAVQELRIKYRWEAIDEENQKIQEAKAQEKVFIPEELENGDTRKQLLARSRYILFKHKSKWTVSQEKRAKILFEHYPVIKEAYLLAIKLGDIFNHTSVKGIAFTKLAKWYDEIERAGLKSFHTVARSIESHYISILNFFNNRSTNAAAESFNSKIKALRNSSRGVRDVRFFLFRLSKIYA